MNDDLISRQDAIDAMLALQAEDDETYGCRIPEGFNGDRAAGALKALPPAQPAWIPVMWHYATESELEERPDIAIWFDCNMPNDGDEILITTGQDYVEKDICYIDEGFSLDSGHDWIYDVKAWKPMPAPYRGGKNV